MPWENNGPPALPGQFGFSPSKPLFAVFKTAAAGTYQRCCPLKVHGLST
jgi:hypothetical protein